MPKIIDTHVHVTPPQIIKNEERYCQKDEYFDLLCSNPKNEFVTYDELAKKMEEEIVDRAVIFGFAFEKQELCREVNDYVIAAVNEHPDKFIGFCVVNPGEEGALKELQRCKNNGIQGIGELFPAGQKFDLSSKKDMEPICRFARRSQWPILIHLNEPVGHDYAGKTDITLEEGSDLANNFPENEFIFAHWGGGLPFFELMPELKDSLSNIYYDTAASPFLYKENIYNVMKEINILDKILLATDYPLLSADRYLQEINKTDLDKGEKKMILHKNAENLLGF